MNIENYPRCIGPTIVMYDTIPPNTIGTMCKVSHLERLTRKFTSVGDGATVKVVNQGKFIYMQEWMQGRVNYSPILHVLIDQCCEC